MDCQNGRKHPSTEHLIINDSSLDLDGLAEVGDIYECSTLVNKESLVERTDFS